MIHCWKGPLANLEGAMGTAGGYGYDKRSAAIADALRNSGFFHSHEWKGNDLITTVTDTNAEGKRPIDICPVEGGAGNEQSAFELAGYTWFSVIG